MDYYKLEKHFTDYIIELVGPTDGRDKLRTEKFQFLKKTITSAIENENPNSNFIPHVLCFGSFPLKIYLEEADLDITVVFEDKSTNTLITNSSFEFVNKIILLIQTTLENYNNETQSETFSDINLIFADIKLLKCKFDSLSIDISINNYGGLSKLAFMNYLEKNLEERIKNKMLFKRTLLLIKAWSYYEGCILGSSIGLMASYALEVLVIYLFNNFSHLFNSEVEAFFTFFQIMKEIDWDTDILHIFGTLSLNVFGERLKILNSVDTDYIDPFWYLDNETLADYPYALNPTEAGRFVREFEKISLIDKTQMGKKLYTFKLINIIDPMFSGNNLGKSITFHNCSKIKKVIEISNREIDEIILVRNKNDPYNYLNSIMKMFQKTLCNNYSEFLLSSLSIPKIIINPYMNISYKDESFNKNTVSLKNGCSSSCNGNTNANGNYYAKGNNSNNSQYMFPTISETLVSKFNKFFIVNKSYKTHTEESKYTGYGVGSSNKGGFSNILTKDIIEYLIKKLEDGENKEYEFKNFYEQSYLDEFLKKVN